MMRMRWMAPYCAALILALASGAGAASVGSDGGLEDYWVLRTPSYSGATMSTRAWFSVRPDDGSVLLVLEGRSGGYSEREHLPSDAFQEDEGYFYDFSFPIYDGTWRMTLYWEVDGEEHGYERDFRVSSGSYDEWYEDDWDDRYLWDREGCSAGGAGALALLLCLPLLRRRGR